MRLVKWMWLVLVLILVSLVASAEDRPRMYAVVTQELAPNKQPVRSVVIPPDTKWNHQFGVEPGPRWECAILPEDDRQHRLMMCRQCKSCGAVVFELECDRKVTAFRMSQLDADGKAKALSAISVTCTP